MKLLDRHILRELLGPFVFGVAAFTSLMFAGKELFSITELMAEYHASLIVAVKLFFLLIPSLVVMTLPMAMLLSALLGFGRLSGDSEVVALFASGVSLYRIAIPVVILAILVTVSSFVLSEKIAPQAFYEYQQTAKQLRHDATSNTKPILGQELEDETGRGMSYNIKGGLDISSGVAKDVTVVQFENHKPVLLIYGKEALWSGDEHPDQWRFKQGFVNALGSGQTYSVPKFNDTVVKINRTPSQLELYQKKPDEMNFNQLQAYIRLIEKERQDTKQLRVRLYQKISLPIASLIFALIGTPLGLRPQRSSPAMGLGLSIVIIFAYWVLTHYMSLLGENGTLSPVAACLIPNLAGVATGIALIKRAAK